MFTLFVSAFIMMLGGGSVNALTAALPHDVYSFSTKMGYALLLSSIGAGWVLGSLFLLGHANRIQRLNRKVVFWLITGIFSGLTIVLVVNTAVFLVGCVIWFSHGVFNCIRDVIETTIVQETVDEGIMGRVFSVQGLLIELASIISMGIGGVLYNIYGGQTGVHLRRVHGGPQCSGWFLLLIQSHSPDRKRYISSAFPNLSSYLSFM